MLLQLSGCSGFANKLNKGFLNSFFSQLLLIAMEEAIVSVYMPMKKIFTCLFVFLPPTMPDTDGNSWGHVNLMSESTRLIFLLHLWFTWFFYCDIFYFNVLINWIWFGKFSLITMFRLQANAKTISKQTQPVRKFFRMN